MTTKALIMLPPLVLIGLMAGFFYAFSVCVMDGLGRRDPHTAISAMQGINEAVRNPMFFITFFFSPVIIFVSALALWRFGQKPGVLWMTLAGAIYVFGVIIITARINVPMNTALAGFNHAAADADAVWQAYLSRWAFWNNIRTLAATLSLTLVGTAMLIPLR